MLEVTELGERNVPGTLDHELSNVGPVLGVPTVLPASGEYCSLFLRPCRRILEVWEDTTVLML